MKLSIVLLMGRLRKFNVGIACLQRISEISMFLSQKRFLILFRSCAGNCKNYGGKGVDGGRLCEKRGRDIEENTEIIAAIVLSNPYTGNRWNDSRGSPSVAEAYRTSDTRMTVRHEGESK